MVGIVAAVAASAAPAVAQQTVASGLDRPRGLAVAPDGTLYATIIGHGGSACDGGVCYGTSGKVVRFTPGGQVSTVAKGFASIVGLPDKFVSLGAGQLTVLKNGRLATAMTAEFNDQNNRPPSFVPNKIRRQLGHIISFNPFGPLSIGADVSAPEFVKDRDGEGKASNPYGIASFGNTVYVTDAGANTLLRVSGGKVKVVTTFPHPSAGAQSVPDAIAAGPDGALYIGEYTGGDQEAGTARIWRIVPGQRKRVFARGLTTISAIAVGPDRSVYVTEFETGSVKRIAPDGTRTTLTDELHFPGGIAVTKDNAIYVSDWSVAGSTPASSGQTKGQTGRIVRLTG